nr:Uma2 family endonuclease [Oscillatoria acuminata]
MISTESFTPLPDHTQLPCEDGTFVQNFQEHPQSILLTDSILPVLDAKHPDGNYCIGQDSGIYWRITDPPLKGAKAPDWFYVPNVPPSLDGQPRRSYVLWQDVIPPLIIMEFVLGNGSEERDKTPWEGKFWIYKIGMRSAYYAIYEVEKASVELYGVKASNYELIPANERGHFPIIQLGVELGIWSGKYCNMDFPWLRWWDSQGNLLLSGHEQAEQEHERADRLAARLRELGVDPEELAD